MQGNTEILEALNGVLTAELTAINQYFIHHRMCANWGYEKLSAKKREESIEEMQHADKVIDRILFLDGLPNFQLLGRLKIGETVEEILKSDLELEYEALPVLRDAIAYCESIRDFVSRDLFDYILKSEEEHVDTLETQFEMIERMGIQNYDQLQSKAKED